MILPPSLLGGGASSKCRAQFVLLFTLMESKGTLTTPSRGSCEDRLMLRLGKHLECFLIPGRHLKDGFL